MRVILKDLKQNGPNHPRLKSFVVYACLYEYDNPEHLIISATLDYIAKTIEERKYILMGFELPCQISI